MDSLYQRHDVYLRQIPMKYIRGIINEIDWNLRLIVIKGPKGVGKSTLLLQYIKQNYASDDRRVLYCSADTSYFANHTIIDTIAQFEKYGGTHIFIDEIHKYDNWSREIKEAYDLYPNVRIVLSGSSLIEINSGSADLSRRLIHYNMDGLSFREYIWFETGKLFDKITLSRLLSEPNKFCETVLSEIKPLSHWQAYLAAGYYPFHFENKRTTPIVIENIVDYIINSELTAYRGVETGNTRKLKAMLKVVSKMLPYEVDIKKLSGAISIERATTLKYLTYLEEAKLIRRLFTNLDTITSLQKPDKILFDNSNLLYTLSDDKPEIGTIRETFFCNQLAASGHRIEYGGLATADFKIDGETIIEVGGKSKGLSQLNGEENSYVAADDIETASYKKIPLWAFGFLY